MTHREKLVLFGIRLMRTPSFLAQSLNERF